MNIRYLNHNEIDKPKWDKCINISFNGLFYAYSWYLDIVSYQWDALVLDDYQAVMPLTIQKTISFSSLKQPKYAAQLGIFTSKLLTNEMVNEFLSVASSNFKRIEICLNSFNKTNHPKYSIKREYAFQLDLILPYKALLKSFDSNIKKNIQSYRENKVQVLKQVNLKDFLLLKKNTAREPVTFEELNILRRIIPFAVSHKIGEIIGAYNDKNELVSASFFIKSHEKSINLISANSDEGNELNAPTAIFDYYIKENAEQSITLDFGESSNINEHQFANGFGAIPVGFYRLKKKRWFHNFIS